MTYPTISQDIFSKVERFYIEKIIALSTTPPTITAWLDREVAYMKWAEWRLAYKNNQIFMKNADEIFIAGYKASKAPDFEDNKVHEFDDFAEYGYTIIQTQGPIQPSQAVEEHIDKLKKFQL